MDWPAKATFVTPEEKELVTARLQADSDAVADESVSWKNVMSAMSDYKVWLYGACFHTLSLPLYTLSMFLVLPLPAIKHLCQQRKANTVLQPSIIKDLGYSAAEAQLLTIPPYALATILTVVYAVVSERYSRRGPFILFSTTIAIIGYIILLSNTSPTSKPGVSYVGVFFAAAGIYPSVALALSWPAVNVSGQTKRATANAMQITIGNVGAVIGTQLYRPTGAPRYVVGHGTALGYLVGNLVVVSVIWWVHARVNRQRDREVAEGKRYEGEWLGDADQRWRFGL
jgi:nitrate/nitrite transporter NarK